MHCFKPVPRDLSNDVLLVPFLQTEYVRSADVPLLSYENLVVRPQKEINKYPRDQKRILLVRSADKWPVSLFSKP